MQNPRSVSRSDWRKDLEATLRLIPGYDPWATAGDAWLDHEAARRAIEFFPECLRHVEGGVAGQPFVLEKWQQAFIGNLFGWKKKDRRGRVVRRYRETLLFVPRKNGKMLDLSTPVPTPSGWTTMGELREGDQVFDESGAVCKVAAVHPVDPSPESYRVRFSNGETINACADHLWVTTARIDRPGGGIGYHKTSLTRARTTREIYETQRTGTRGDVNHSVQMPGPIQCEEADLPIHPYVMGVWLGDGDSGAARITCARADLEICDHLRECGESATVCDYRATPTVVTVRVGSIDTCCRGHDEGERVGTRCKACERERDRAERRSEPVPPVTHRSLQARLKLLGVLGNKHIPDRYMRASATQRLHLLQGLMDTDGFVSKAGQCEFATSVESLGVQVREILSSLGIKSSLKKRTTRAGRDEPVCDSWRLSFFTDQQVCRMKRKASRLKPSIARAATLQIVSVEPIDPVPMRCITVDAASGQYLCGRTMVPTHNTPLAAGVCVMVLATDGEPGAQIVSAAGDKDQAALLFRHAKGMVEREEELANRITVFAGAAGTGGQRSMVLKSDPASVYKVISADADTKHGGNLHVALIDELHVQPNRDLVDTLVTGTASENRAQPLIVYITTADYDRPSICNEVYQRAVAVRDNGGDPAKPGYDPAFLPCIYEAAPGSDWMSPETWAAANPNLGVSVSLDYLHRECQKAKETPSYENTFKRLHLNMRTRSDVRWLSLEAWDACREEFSPAMLEGRRCVAALDLSAKIDVTALILWFPPEEPDGTHYLLEEFFAPTDTAQRRERNDRVPYTAWIRDGWMTGTPGNVVDYAAIEQRLKVAAAKYRLGDVAYDPWNATYVATRMQDDGAQMVEFRQGYQSMSDPSKELEKLIVAGRLKHRGNPCMRWMVGNAAIEKDPAGNIKPSKAKSTERIDGVVAAVMALGRALVKPQSSDSVYEQRGIVTL